MTNSYSDFWQISILTDTNRTILVTINKNESVEALFKKFRSKYSVFRKQKRLTFLAADGLELQQDDKSRLVDVDCLRDKCNIRLIIHADGGGWPTEADVRNRPRDPTKVPSLTGRLTNELPDILDMDSITPRVKMSCDHAIAPSSLALHCYDALDNGAHLIKCPDCNTVWSFKSVIDAACLSLNETNEFELKMISNRLADQSAEIKECPGCGNSCRRLNEDQRRLRCRKCTSEKGRNFDFCWSCQKEWRNSRNAVLCGNLGCGDHAFLFECLANCDTKILNGMECPTRRACPNCLTLIEHTEKCKHMKCPTKNCKYDFCFICLKHYPCGTGPQEACGLAPRQQPNTPPPPPPPSKCAIL